MKTQSSGKEEPRGCSRACFPILLCNYSKHFCSIFHFLLLHLLLVLFDFHSHSTWGKNCCLTHCLPLSSYFSWLLFDAVCSLIVFFFLLLPLTVPSPSTSFFFFTCHVTVILIRLPVLSFSLDESTSKWRAEGKGIHSQTLSSSVKRPRVWKEIKRGEVMSTTNEMKWTTGWMNEAITSEPTKEGKHNIPETFLLTSIKMHNHLHAVNF